jgi:long-chain acyl-CoA synthetase
MQSHRAVILNGAMTAQLHLKTPLDTVVTALPCPHVYGNVVFNGALMYGLKLVLHPRFDAAELLTSIQTHKATMFEGVPTMYMVMLVHPDFDRFDLSSLTRCAVGGQTMPVAKMQEVERRFACPLIELWGMTELPASARRFPRTVPTSSARSVFRSLMSKPASPTSPIPWRPCLAERSASS